jgi:integrase/recombinase XerC/integrase/recombinase XerD
MTRALRAVDSPSVSLSEAITAYLATLDHPESRNTRKQYGLTLRRMARDIGEEEDVSGISADRLVMFARAAWGGCKPATWNAGRTCLRSAWAWFAAEGWADASVAERIERRTVPADRDRAIPRDVLDALLADQKVSLRERTLWRMMHETAARESEILRLDVGDLDRAHNRARVVRKGGAGDVVVYQSGTAMALPRLLKGRRSGPLFVTERKAPAGTARADVAPDGRGRLSARQAQDIFLNATQGFPGGPWTLHGIRHRALTDAAEQGASTAMMMALSGHKSVKSLAIYARVGMDALAAWQAERDPNRRH